MNSIRIGDSFFFLQTAAFVTTLGYTIYGILLKDSWIFFANAPGLALTTFYTLTAVAGFGAVGSTRNIRASNTVQMLFIVGIMFWVVVGLYCGWVYTDKDGRDKSAAIFGVYSSTFCILYYAAPLSTAMDAIARRDASSLHASMICVNLLNSTMWFLYGYIAIHRYQIWLPNIIGAVLACSQLVLLLALSSRSSEVSALYRPIIEREAAIPIIPHFVPAPAAPTASAHPLK